MCFSKLQLAFEPQSMWLNFLFHFMYLQRSCIPARAAAVFGELFYNFEEYFYKIDHND